MPQRVDSSLLVYSEVCCRSHSYFEDVAERSEQKLDKRTILFSRGLSAESGTELPSPGDPLTLGIYAGYVRGQHKQGQFRGEPARVSWRQLWGSALP